MRDHVKLIFCVTVFNILNSILWGAVEAKLKPSVGPGGFNISLRCISSRSMC